MSWKTRLKSGRPSEAPDYGSFYTIIPKGQVEGLSWHAGQRLRSKVVDDSITLSAAPPEAAVAPRAVRKSGTKFDFDRVVCGDVLEVMAQIPNDSVHMLITSPPYNIGIPYVGYDDRRAYADYRSWLGLVWKEALRVLKRGGRLALEIAPTGIADFVPLHHDLTWDIRATGFTHRAEILWAKQNMTAPRTAWGSFGSPRHPHLIPSWEYIEIFHKESWKLEGDRSDIDISPKQFVEWSDGVWEIPPESRRPGAHPAAFPVELIERLILFFTYRGNVVMDPFGGSGTVAVAAKRNGRSYLHIDQSEDYCEEARTRLEATEVRQRPTEVERFRRSSPIRPVRDGAISRTDQKLGC